LAVSGEHATLQMMGNDVFIEDLNSTNGTYINGRAIKKQLLAHNDTVEIGKYKIKYLVDETADFEKTMIMRPGSMAPSHTPFNHTAPMPVTPPMGGLSGGSAMGLAALRPSSNGVPLASETAPLSNGDLIELAGTQMQFIQG
ncbi:MAG: FHA domain-containing protein, partial [Burkholderiales bacterium PBB5]